MPIRPMTETDLPKVLEIERVSFPCPWGEWAFRVELKPPGYAFVYELSGEVVGYAVVRIIREEGHLLNIAVAPERRRQGIGTELLRFCIDLCVKRGVKDIWLEVRESNLEAISIYKKMGFIKVGTRRRYYQDTDEDALIMRLRLKDDNAVEKR